MLAEERQAIIDERFLGFLDIWPEMRYGTYITKVGKIYAEFHIEFKNSTMRGGGKSSTLYRPFNSKDFTEILDAVIFLEGYLKCKVDITRFKLSRNEFSFQITFSPIN